MDVNIFTAIIGLISSLVIFGIKEKKKSESKTIEQEITNLDNISKSLNGLQKFIDNQKNNLIENENTILELEKRKEKLKPLVETQEQTIEAILSAHTESQNKSKWFDYLMGFFIGVASSSIVTLIFFYLQKE